MWFSSDVIKILKSKLLFLQNISFLHFLYIQNLNIYAKFGIDPVLRFGNTVKHFEISDVPDERVNSHKNGYLYVIFKFSDVIII